MVLSQASLNTPVISEHDEIKSKHQAQRSRDHLLFMSGDWLGVQAEKEFWAITCLLHFQIWHLQHGLQLDRICGKSWQTRLTNIIHFSKKEERHWLSERCLASENLTGIHCHIPARLFPSSLPNEHPDEHQSEDVTEAYSPAITTTDHPFKWLDHGTKSLPGISL